MKWKLQEAIEANTGKLLQIFLDWVVDDESQWLTDFHTFNSNQNYIYPTITENIFVTDYSTFFQLEEKHPIGRYF